MAKVIKALKLLNDTIELVSPQDEGVYTSIQYGAFGEDGVTAATGTVVLEGTDDDITWFIIGINPSGGGAAVASLAAPGAGYAITPYSRVRGRMSVVGGAQGVKVELVQKIST